MEPPSPWRDGGRGPAKIQLFPREMEGVRCLQLERLWKNMASASAPMLHASCAAFGINSHAGLLHHGQRVNTAREVLTVLLAVYLLTLPGAERIHATGCYMYVHRRVPLPRYVGCQVSRVGKHVGASDAFNKLLKSDRWLLHAPCKCRHRC